MALDIELSENFVKHIVDTFGAIEAMSDNLSMCITCSSIVDKKATMQIQYINSLGQIIGQHSGIVVEEGGVITIADLKIRNLVSLQKIL